MSILLPYTSVEIDRLSDGARIAVFYASILAVYCVIYTSITTGFIVVTPINPLYHPAAWKWVTGLD